MMYRSGWARRPNQERILRTDIDRAGFEWALAHSALSHFQPGVHADRDQWHAEVAVFPVRVQWDPDRSIHLEPQPWRAIQVGLSGEAVVRYVDHWIVDMADVTRTGTVDPLRRTRRKDRGRPASAAGRAPLPASGARSPGDWERVGTTLEAISCGWSALCHVEATTSPAMTWGGLGSSEARLSRTKSAALEIDSSAPAWSWKTLVETITPSPASIQ